MNNYIFPNLLANTTNAVMNILVHIISRVQESVGPRSRVAGFLWKCMYICLFSHVSILLSLSSVAWLIVLIYVRPKSWIHDISRGSCPGLHLPISMFYVYAIYCELNLFGDFPASI